MAAEIGARALIPNPRLAALAFLVGEWTTVGSHPMLPGPPLQGNTSFGWSDGGAFLVMRSQVDQPQVPDGVAYFGSDEHAGIIVMIYFDERQVSRIYNVIVGDGSVMWSREDAELAQTMTLTLQPDGTIRGQGRMSQNGGAWGDDLSQTFSPV